MRILLLTALALVLCRVRATNAQVVIGDTVEVGGFLIERPDSPFETYPLGEVNYHGADRHGFSYKMEGFLVHVYFAPRTTETVRDTSYWLSTDSPLRVYRQTTHVASGYGVPDTLIRIRPQSLKIVIAFDSVNRSWATRIAPAISNQTADNVQVTYMDYRRESGPLVFFGFDSTLQPPFTLPSHQVGQLPIRITSDDGSAGADTAGMGTLRIVVRRNGIDSTYLIPTTILLKAAPCNCTFSLSTDTLRFSSTSYVGNKESIVLSAPGFKYASLGPLEFPFHASLRASGKDSNVIEVALDGTTSGYYRDLLSILATTRDFRGALHTSTLHVVLEANVTESNEPVNWRHIPVPLPSTIRGLRVHSGDLFAYGAGLYRVSHAWNMDTLLTPTHDVRNLSVGARGDLLASTGDMLLYRAAGRVSWDTLAPLVYIAQNYPPARCMQHDALLIAHDRFYACGSLDRWSSFYHRWFTTTVLFASSDTGRSWTSVQAVGDSITNPGTWTQLVEDSNEVLVAVTGEYDPSHIYFPRKRYNERINDFAAPDTSQTFFATTSGIHGTDSGLFQHSVLSLAFSPSGLLAAAAGDGIFKTTDNGQRWMGYNAGLPARDVKFVASDPTGYDYAWSTSSGLYAGDAGRLHVPVRNNKFESVLLIQPNPASDWVTVALPAGCFELSCFDLLGRRILTVPVPTGERSIAVATNAIKNGLYYLTAVSAAGSYSALLRVSH